MATFEKRKNVDGKVTAIRVKIRRVGLPHLSQTFPVLGDSPNALKKAEKAAKAWVNEVTQGLGLQHGNHQSIKAQFNAIGRMPQPVEARQQAGVLLAFDRAISREQGDAWIIHSEPSEARLMTALLLDCGLTVDEVIRLRWQHLLLNQKMLQVIGRSGMVLRQVPLSTITLEALLTQPQRKYGLLFTHAPDALYALLPPALLHHLQQKSEGNLLMAFKQEAAHRMADLGCDEATICSTLGVVDLQALSLDENRIPLIHQGVFNQ